MNLPIPSLRYLLVVLAAAAISACSSNPARPSQAEFGSAWKSVSCKTFDVPDAIAVDADCGYVMTPEQHAQPQGPTIELAVVRVRSSGNTPAADPLFVEQGGPGDTTHHRGVCQSCLADEVTWLDRNPEAP